MKFVRGLNLALRVDSLHLSKHMKAFRASGEIMQSILLNPFPLTPNPPGFPFLCRMTLPESYSLSLHEATPCQYLKRSKHLNGKEGGAPCPHPVLLPPRRTLRTGAAMPNTQMSRNSHKCDTSDPTSEANFRQKAC